MSRIDIETLRATVEGILQSSDPPWRLADTLFEAERQQNPGFAVAVFEGVIAKQRIEHFWVYSSVSQAYLMLGDNSAAYIAAATAMRIEPNGPSGPTLNRLMFRYLYHKGHMHDALDVFLSSLERFPGAFLATREELDNALRITGRSLLKISETSDRPLLRRDHQVFAQEKRAPWECLAVYGGNTPRPIAELRAPADRPAIDVAMLDDAELLVLDEQVVVLGSDGKIQHDLCVSPFPELIVRQFEAFDTQPDTVEHLKLAEAAIIVDSWPAPNYCHFLFDQLTRLALYKSVGVDIRQVAILGPEPRTAYQQYLIAAAGVGQYMGLARRARIKINRLWISTTCGRGCNHAHLGASWCFDFIRETFGIGVEPATRRLYMSRNDGTKRRVVNEDEIVPLLARYGFEKIVPGQLSVPEQIAAFRQASHVIAPHGAGVSNIVFSPPGLHLLEMFHPLFASTAFTAAAAALKVNYSAMVARDREIDPPDFTNPQHAQRSLSDFWAARDMRVDKQELMKWLSASGCLT